MDTLLPRHKYVVLTPQVGPLTQDTHDRWDILKEQLEVGGAVIVKMFAVPGVTAVQFVDVTNEAADYHDAIRHALGDPGEPEGRARQTKSFGT